MSFFVLGCDKSAPYTPPTLHKGVRWFVYFSAYDPARGIMTRKRYYITDNLSISTK